MTVGFLFLFFNWGISQQASKIRFEHLTVNEGLSENAVISVTQDSQGFMWIGTHDGLNKYDGYSFTIYKYDPEDKNSLSDNAINTIYEDYDGMLWIGTIGGGLNRFNPFNQTCTRYPHQKNNPESFISDVIWDVLRDSKGRLWLSHGLGVARFNPKTRQFVHITPQNGWFLEDKSGRLWLLNWRRTKIYYFDETAEIFELFSLPINGILGKNAGSPVLLFLKRSGIVLVLSNNKIFKYSLQDKEFINSGNPWFVPSEIKPTGICFAMETSSGRIMIGTVSRLEPGSYVVTAVEAGFKGQQVDTRSIKIAPHGRYVTVFK
jgi:sugar lactone lactonase YvrE